MITSATGGAASTQARAAAQVGYDVSVVDSEAGFESLRADWLSVATRLQSPSPFQSFEWNRSWWRHFGGRDRLQLLVFRRAGAVTGIAQLRERRHGPAGLGPSSLAPLGWGNLLTERLELLFPLEHRAGLLAELSSWLDRKRWDFVCLPGLAAEDMEAAWIADGAVRSVDMPFEWRELPGRWEDLVQRLNKSMRDNVRYYPRLMERTGVPYAFRVAGDATEALAWLPDLWRLHGARAAGGSGVRHLDYLERADFRAFLTEVTELLAPVGGVRLGRLEVAGEVIAIQMWMEQAGVAYLYYSGFDPAWSKYSVAMITAAEIIKDCIGRGLGAVDFLRGTGQFKQRWDTERRVSTDVVIAHRPTLVRPLLKAHRRVQLVVRGARRDLQHRAAGIRGDREPTLNRPGGGST